MIEEIGKALLEMQNKICRSFHITPLELEDILNDKRRVAKVLYRDKNPLNKRHDFHGKHIAKRIIIVALIMMLLCCFIFDGFADNIRLTYR